MQNKAFSELLLDHPFTVRFSNYSETRLYSEFQGFSETIIFGSILTTFDVSFIFWGSWGSIKNLLELKIEPP